jgi:hypothetical protein
LPKPLRMPPRIKVLEALGSLADGRVRLLPDGSAEVVSSDGTRRYSVWVSSDGRRAYSTDNGTAYRGYVGYPIIAVMMLRGILPYRKELAEALRGIRWRSLNEKYKRYWVVEKIVKSIASKRGVRPKEIDEFVDEVMEALRKLSPVMEESIPGTRRPSASSE